MRATMQNSTKQTFNFANYVLHPLKSGIIGFVLFLAVLIITKFLAHLLGIQENFSIELEDILLCTVGFFLLSLIRFMENFRSE